MGGDWLMPSGILMSQGSNYFLHDNRNVLYNIKKITFFGLFTHRDAEPYNYVCYFR